MPDNRGTLARGPDEIVAPSPLARLRKICLALPEAHEVEAWGEPTFRVRNKMFATWASAESHHGAGRPSVWCKADFINQSLVVQSDASRYFVPPYVGVRGWIGIHLDDSPDWSEVIALIEDSYRLVAPKRLLAEISAPGRKSSRR